MLSRVLHNNEIFDFLDKDKIALFIICIYKLLEWALCKFLFKWI